MQISPHRQRQLAPRIEKLRRLDDFPQRNRLPPVVRNFNANRGFAWDTLDQDRLRLQRQAKILGKPGNPAVLDARFRFEFERRNHRPGINLCHAPLHIKFQAFCFDRAGAHFQIIFIQFLAAFALAEQGRRRKFVMRAALRDFWLAGSLNGGFLGIPVENEDRRLWPALSLFLILFLDLVYALEYIALLGEANRLGIILEFGFSKQLRRNWLPARKAGLFHPAPHALLFAFFTPGLPACLRFLQNAQLLNGPDWPLRAVCPRIRPRETKPVSPRPPP